MPAANYDIVAEEGASFTLRMLYKDDNNDAIDLQELGPDNEPLWAARLQIRSQIQDKGTLIEIPAQNECGHFPWLPPPGNEETPLPSCIASADEDDFIFLGDGTQDFNLEINISSITMEQGNGTFCCPRCTYGEPYLLAGRHFYDLELVKRRPEFGLTGDGQGDAYEPTQEDGVSPCNGIEDCVNFYYPCMTCLTQDQQGDHGSLYRCEEGQNPTWQYPCAIDGNCGPLDDPDPQQVVRLLQGRFVIVPNVTRVGI